MFWAATCVQLQPASPASNLDSVADHFYSLWEGIVVPQFPIWQMGSSSTSWATEGFHFMSCKDLENGKYSMKPKGNCIAYCNLSSHCLLPTVFFQILFLLNINLKDGVSM